MSLASGILLVCLLRGGRTLQIPGIHIGDFTGFGKRLEALYQAGLYDHQSNVMRVDAFDYTVDPHTPDTANYFGTNFRLKAIRSFEDSHPGITVKLLLRCTRTRGEQIERIPIDPEEQKWWGNFVAGKAKLLGGPIGGWNEQSLGWSASRTNAESYDRPERQAACTHQLISAIRAAGLTTKVLCPSVHSLKDSVTGDAWTYTKRFFAALPREDYAFVAPDAHLYYGAYVPADKSSWRDDVPDDLARWLNYLGSLGFSPSDTYISEFGSTNFDRHRGPTSSESADRTEMIYEAILAAGIPAEHCYVWWGHGAMELFDETGAKTPFGEKVSHLMKAGG